MEQKPAAVDRSMEVPEGGLKALVLRWFTETQAAGLMQSGQFPDWFQGFTTRKDAEEQLREKAVGFFLIRLSEKAIGYVLSYKGQDRCRHFVITQNQEGLFSISGDEQTYSSLSELIEHYKVIPIQPFGEYLTSNSEETEEDTTELYDVVNVKAKEKSGVSVQALCSLWDQKKLLSCETFPKSKQQQLNNNSNNREKLPTLPPKPTNRRLTGSVSVDTTAISQSITNKAPSLGLLPAVSSSDSSHHHETPLTPNITQPGESNPILRQDHSPNLTRTAPPKQVTYSSIVQPEQRSKSLPCLDNQDELPTAPPVSTSYTMLKKVTCHTYSLHEPRDSTKTNEELLRCNPLYEPSGVQQGDTPYAEIAEGDQTEDRTYEDITGRDTAKSSNTYESLEELKTKKSKHSWVKHKEWKNIFTDYMKK